VTGVLDAVPAGGNQIQGEAWKSYSAVKNKQFFSTLPALQFSAMFGIVMCVLCRAKNDD
jgi:hypothetical protein